MVSLVVPFFAVHAQYTADYQTNIIYGVTNNWSGDYLVGSNTFADALLIQTNGVLSNAFGYVGYEVISSNNSVLVSDRFSLWRNVGSLYVGYSGGGGSLAVSNRAVVISDNGFVGYNSNSSGNCVLVTGAFSLWNNHTNLYVGYSGVSNSLVVRNSGSLYSPSASIGYNVDASGNSVLVSDPGSVWRGSGITSISGLTVGSYGSGNSLIISNGGQVLGVGTVGNQYSSSNNCVSVCGTNSVWNGGGSTLVIGNYGAGNSLVIRSGGQVMNGEGRIGFSSPSSNNSVLVEGSGSVWQNGGLGEFYLGGWGSGNNLTVRNGGKVTTPNSYFGYYVGSNNCAVVTDVGSTWVTANMYIGGDNYYANSAGPDNSLIVSNGGQVVSGSSFIGYNATDNGNNAVITGSGSVWTNSGDLYVGHGGSGSSLTICSGGKVFDGYGYVGYWQYGSSSNNSVLISGSGSVWSNRNWLFFGVYGCGNSAVVTNGGQVVDVDCFIGSDSSSNNSVIVVGTNSLWKSSQFECDGSGNSLAVRNGGQILDSSGIFGTSGSYNSALVTDPGSVWSNQTILEVGTSGIGHSLIISNGGQVVSVLGLGGCVGCTANNMSNTVRVVDGGIWQSGSLSIGSQGSGNSLVVAGGSVVCNGLTVGSASTTCDNWVQLDSGSVVVTNSMHNATLEVRQGALILSGGLLRVDRLVITNACARFIRNGGTLIVGTLVLDPALDADGDGLPNGWEQTYGLDPLSPNGNDGANGDPDGDGMTNLQEFQAGSNPVADIKAIAREGDDIRVTWQAAAGKTNSLQRSLGSNGSYSNSFADIFTVTNNVGNVTNHLDIGAATNVPSRFYRVRLVP